LLQAGDEAVGPLAEVAEAPLARLDLVLGFDGGLLHVSIGGRLRGDRHGSLGDCEAGTLGKLRRAPRLFRGVESRSADGHHRRFRGTGRRQGQLDPLLQLADQGRAGTGG